MSGELPLLSLRISDDKLRSVLALVDSIPLPESKRATVPSTMPKVRKKSCLDETKSDELPRMSPKNIWGKT